MLLRLAALFDSRTRFAIRQIRELQAQVDKLSKKVDRATDTVEKNPCSTEATDSTESNSR